MKKLSLLVAAVFVFAALVGAASNKVMVEAEKYTSITPSMAKASDSLASGGFCVQVPVARPHGTTEGASKDQGKAVYTVNVPSAGTYRFWARTWWFDGCGNSFHLKIGTKPAVVLGQDGTYKKWHWVKGPVMQLPAGTVTIVVQNREDGAKLDQFLLTKDQRYIPVRAER